MAKFINILAASVGGGILLGAGIRLGEAIVGRDPAATRDRKTGGKLEARLGELEDRLVNLEAVNPDRKARPAAIRSELGREGERIAALSQIGAQLRVELQGWLEQSVGSRVADVEAKLKAESDDVRRQLLDAFAESVEARVAHRISQLEEEVAGQSAAMVELRDCSLRTEQSLQKLLGGLDRLLVPRPAAPQPDFSSHEEAIPQSSEPAGDSPAQQPEIGRSAESDLESKAEGVLSSDPAAPEPQLKPRRWSLFG